MRIRPGCIGACCNVGAVRFATGRWWWMGAVRRALSRSRSMTARPWRPRWWDRRTTPCAGWSRSTCRTAVVSGSSRTFLAFWTGYAAAELKPLWRPRRPVGRRPLRARIDSFAVDGCARSCCDRAGCSSTRPGPRSSILAVGAPRPATSGPSPVTIAAATAAIRRRSSTAMRPAAAPSMPSPC